MSVFRSPRVVEKLREETLPRAPHWSRALLEKRFKGTDSEAGCPADLGPDGEVLLPTHLEDEI